MPNLGNIRLKRIAHIKCPVCGKPITEHYGVALNLRDHLNKVHKRRCTNRMVDLANDGLMEKQSAGTSLKHYRKR